MTNSDDDEVDESKYIEQGVSEIDTSLDSLLSLVEAKPIDSDRINLVLRAVSGCATVVARSMTPAQKEDVALGNKIKRCIAKLNVLSKGRTADDVVGRVVCVTLVQLKSVQRIKS